MEKFPLLEYDSDPDGVVAVDHEKLGLRLPQIAVFAFVGEAVDEFAEKNGAVIVSHFVSTTKKYPIYVLNFKGREICLCQAPCGGAPAAQILDWLIGYGVRKIIATGCCGVLQDIPENAFLVPDRALRDEGTSYHYLPAERFIRLDEKMVDHITGFFRGRGIPFSVGATWTTDGFFRETRKKVLARRAEGCVTVEMECASLAACAAFRKAEFGQFFFTADSLYETENYQERGWGEASLAPALALAVEIAAAL